MKAIAYQPHRSRSSSRPSISLFPFLAVLICTMVALVPLLLAITRTARRQAESAALAKASEVDSQVQMEQEKVQWRIAQFKNSRRTTENQLADARLELGHIEDHTRRLGEQLARYKQTIDDFQRLSAADTQQRTKVEESLKQTQAKVVVAEQELAETRRTAAQRNRSYSVVPYEGPNQTHRRPIYLECRGDAVVLQPEGIQLVDSDFEGPLGPGNPLAALLRAAREYLLSQHGFDPQTGEPYPMLLVRPEGIAAYYAARAAMKSWGFDFGYELIDDDWKLSYPPADSRLADLLRQVVASAREDQARLIAAAPRQYHQRSNVAYRALPNRDGFVADGASPGSDDPGYRSQTSAGPVGQQFGGGGSGNGGAGGLALAGSNAGNGRGAYVGDAPYTGSGPYVAGSPGNGSADAGTRGAGSSVSGGSGAGSVSGEYSGGVGRSGGGNAGSAIARAAGGTAGGSANPYEVASTGGSGGTAQGGGPSGTAVFGDGPAFPNGNVAAAGGGVQNGANGATTANGSPASSGGGSQSAGRATVGGQPLGTYPQNNGLTKSPSGQAPADAQSPSTSRPVEKPDGYVVGQPAHEQVAASTPQQSAGEVGPGRILRPGEWEPDPDPPPEKPKKADDDKNKDLDRFGRKRDKGLIDKREEDWGLRNPANASVGVTRPIRIECYRDRLVVVSERGPAYNKQVAVGPRMASSVDPFISAIWEHMESWGIAGRGMYWRPVLEIEVAPDAQQCFSDLNALLNGSGLTVVRK